MLELDRKLSENQVNLNEKKSDNVENRSKCQSSASPTNDNFDFFYSIIFFYIL